MSELRRELGVWGAAAIVVGTVIGSGIFLVPRSMIERVGSPEMVFVVWVAGGLLSLAGALTYAELAAAYPHSGGEYVYLREAYGPMYGFLYGWTQMWVAKSGSIATIATGFVLYLSNFVPDLEQTLFTAPLPIGPGGSPLEIRWDQICAILLILSLGFLNYFGVRLGGRVQVAATALKLVLIGAIVVVGLVAGRGSVSNLGSSIPVVGGAAAFFAAMVGALWAYDGWNNVTMVAGEVRSPQRNLPIALTLGVVAVVVVYLLTNLAYFYVLPASDVASTDRVASAMMQRVSGGSGAAAVSVAAMISMFAALNGSILTGSRVPYAMAADGLFFRRAASVHPRHRTPSVSIALLTVWSSIVVLSGRFDDLFTYVIFASWLLYGLSAASVIVLRRKRPDLERPYRTVGYPWMPAIFVLVAAVFVVSTLIQSPRESGMGLALIFIGLPFYYRWEKLRARAGAEFPLFDDK